ncbi:MAG: ADP-ribosylation factor-like protein [Candidatus Kariarchaeaceae archaeon]|jgi:GTPase SAR1 family protein
MLSDFLRLIRGFVLFIGPSAAGKTSILRRLVTGKFHDQEPTLGFSQENIAKVRIIEIGGQENLREHWKTALDQKPVKVFFIIDITKENDYTEYLEFVKETNELHPQLSEKLMLITNKIDLMDSIPNYLNTGDFYIRSSAKTGEGMLDILEILANLEGQIKSLERKESSERVSEEINSNQNDDKKAESLLDEFKGKF